MIHVHQLSVHYGTAAALQDIHLDVDPGECVLVTGPSGCGKSTLARVLTGLIPSAIPAQVQGQVQVAGLHILDGGSPRHTVAEIARRVGAVFQNPASQLFHLRVEDELSFGPYNLGLPEAEVRERVEWALKACDLVHLRDRKPASLSGGQKQRVAIAAALAMQPQVLVLDEPTASLDVSGTHQVTSTLKTLRDRYGITIILIEHRLAEAAHLAQRVLVLDGGQICAQGPTDELLSDRKLLHRYGLRRPVDARPETWEQLLETCARQPLEAPSNPVLEMQQVTSGYNGQPAINDVDLKLYPGEFAALVGDNGAGKSTLALTAAGLLKPWRGAVHFQGGQKPQPGLDISLLFQNPADQLFTDSVDEEVAFAPLNYRCFDPDRHTHILQEADLFALRRRKPGAVSMGQQQRTALAACLSLQPRLVILDEPTLGQDWGHLQRLMNYVARLNQQGATILLITHDFKLVHHYAQRVILMNEGHIILDGRLNGGRGDTKP